MEVRILSVALSGQGVELAVTPGSNPGAPNGACGFDSRSGHWVSLEHPVSASVETSASVEIPCFSETLSDLDEHHRLR